VPDGGHAMTDLLFEQALGLRSVSPESPALPDGCEGAGRCHGCMDWCDACGLVRNVCDAADCMHHGKDREAKR